MRLFVPALFLFALGCGNDGGAPSPTAAAPAQAAPPPAAPAPAAPAAPAGAFTCCSDAAAASVVGAYVDAQAALAKDDDATAATHLAALATAVEAARAGGTLDAESSALLATIGTEATATQAAADIATRRTALKKLSAAVIPFAKKQTGGARSVSVAFCPMADASWLQEGATIANPYYGSSMLTCGSFK